MSIKADGTYAIDFQSDGTPEVMGIYRYEEGNMIIKDTSEGPCKGLEAIYAMKVDGNSATATMIEDPCPARAEGNSGGAMNLKRKE